VTSTSWGSPEQSGGDGSEASYQKMVTQGQALFAAAGDAGAYDNCTNNPVPTLGSLSVDDPAVQTNVTGVGGTSVTLNSSTSAYASETTWGNTSETTNCARGAGGGGGISQFTAIPSYQNGIVSNGPAGEFSTTMRNVPDVSLNAEPATGYAVYETLQSGGWTVIGGTSAAAPLWASFWIQINQALKAKGASPAGFANPTIYHLAKNATSYANDFHDINDNSTNLHFHAVNGYDTATGWGSFNGANLFQDVVAYLSPSSVPSAPTNVTAAASGSTQVTLSWNTVPGATAYNIYDSTTPGHEAAPIALTVSGGSATGGTVTGLSSGHTYYFVVQAINSAGHSPSSSEVSASLLVPAAPANVSAVAGNGQATLSWTASANATSYNIYKSTTPGHEAAPIALTVSGGSATGGTVTGLSNGRTYYFVVQAINAVGHSVSSNEASAPLLVPAAPANVTATPGNSQATLNWTAVPGATGYNIYDSITPGHEAAPIALTVSGGSATGGTVTGLSNGRTYYFVVQAINGVGHSPSSSEVSASLLVPAAPANVSAVGGNGQATLSWTASANATGYNIYKSTTPGHEAPPIALTVSGGSATGGTVTGLAHGQTFYFVVQAVNGVGHSPSSTEVNALTN
jgi:fibronectin type 3 domain-containing protein